MSGVMLIADGGTMTVGRRMAAHAYGSFGVSLPDDFEVPEEQFAPVTEPGYVCKLRDDDGGRFDRAFVRADASIDMQAGESDLERVIVDASDRSEGDVFFERDISGAGLGRFTPYEDFDINDVVAVLIWGRILDLPVTAIDMITDELLINWRVHVGGQAFADLDEVDAKSREVTREIAQERLERLRGDAAVGQVATSAQSTAETAKGTADEAIRAATDADGVLANRVSEARQFSEAAYEHSGQAEEFSNAAGNFSSQANTYSIHAAGSAEEAENYRRLAEQSRAAAEEQRKLAEAARRGAEAERADAEDARQAAESERERSESARQAAEARRNEAERERQEAEKARDASVRAAEEAAESAQNAALAAQQESVVTRDMVEEFGEMVIEMQKIQERTLKSQSHTFGASEDSSDDYWDARFGRHDAVFDAKTSPSWTGKVTASISRSDGSPVSRDTRFWTDYENYTIPQPDGSRRITFSGGISNRVNSVLLNYEVNPGVQKTHNRRGGPYAISDRTWTTLSDLTFTAPQTDEYPVYFRVGWDAASFMSNYGIRVLVDGRVVRTVGPHSQLGPLTPLGDGYRNQMIRLNDYRLTSGQRVTFQAYCTSGEARERRIRNAEVAISWIVGA